jgi:hypothetical protein
LILYQQRGKFNFGIGFMDEPLDANDLKKFLLSAINAGNLRFSNHALQEMQKDDLSTLDVVRVLRAGLMREPAEFRSGTWRYRVRNSRIVVVVALQFENGVAVVTAWKVRR